MSANTSTVPERNRGRLQQLLQAPGLQEGLGLLGMLMIIILVMSLLSPYFFSVQNGLNLLLASSTIGLIAMVTTMLMIGGGLDLSVGSTVALVGVVIAQTQSSLGIGGAVAAGLAVGLAIGLVNGLLVTRVGINPLITTLGMLGMARGLAFVLSGGLTEPVLDPAFDQLGQGFVGIIPIPVIALVILTAVCYVVMRYTTYGRAMYSIGGNAEASYLGGLPVKRYQLIAYTLSGLSAALAGVFLTSQLGAGAPQAATGLELSVVAAVVLGGTSLAGGKGNILGTIIGVLILGTLNNGMVLLSISSYYQQVAQGLALLLAVGLDQFRLGGLARPAARREYRIGFANAGNELPAASTVRESVEEAVNQAGGFSLLLLDNKMDAAQARANAERFIADKMDLVIENQVNDQVGAQLVARYRDAGIPVITVDSRVAGAVYFGANNFQAGRTAGEALGAWITRHWAGDVGGIIVIERPDAGSGSVARAGGLREGLESSLGPMPADCVWTVMCDRGHPPAEQQVAQILNGHPGQRIAVLAVDDEAALAAVRAARALDRAQQVAVVGQGAGRAIREELAQPGSPLVGTVLLAHDRYGGSLLQIAQRILAGANVAPENYTDHVLLTAEEAGQSANT
jgi:ribose transport system permease protein